MDFKSLKKNSAKSLDTLTQKLVEETKKTTYADNDETFWMPTLDKAGNGSAVIRLLPTPPQDGEDGTPWVKYFRHSFKGPGGWYIENSLTTLGKADPVAEFNNQLWNTKVKANEEKARKQKRKLTYVSNIEVISDPAKPECNGKVFKWKYGQKIFAKFEEAMSGDPGDEVTPATPGFDPFDFWEGANFRLKVTTTGVAPDRFPNYDESKFGPKTPHKGGDDKALEAIWKSEYSLKALVAEDQFKTYEKLKERLDKVLAVSSQVAATEEEPAEPRKTAETTKVTTRKTVAKKEEDITPPWEPNEPDPEAEENLAYFQALVDRE